ncbi:hypothetical protein EB093_03605 [bacterium]|nr:hypothetical protein [bacterium]
MLSGQDKAKLLLSMLGDRATAVLSLLSPQNATMLTATIGDSPRASQSEISGLILEVMDRVNRAREVASPVFSGAEVEGLGSFQNGIDSEDSSFSSFGFSESSDDALGSATSADEPVSSVEGPRFRSPDAIAGLLMKEKPQISAFVLSRLDESLKLAIVDSFSYEYRELLAPIKVEKVPLSDSVFSKVYERVVLVGSDEDENLTSQASEPDSGFGFSSDPVGISGSIFG